MSKKISTCVLGSSSAGNATLVWNDDTVLLVDCGFGPEIIEDRLSELGFGIQDLDGVFITHIHGDHVNNTTVRKLVKECIPLYCPPKIEHHLRKKYKSIASASKGKIFAPMKTAEVEVHSFSVRAFEVPHDSAGGCFGYSILCDVEGMTRKVTVSTDLACVTAEALEQFADSDVIVLESNYDPDMLEASDRPAWLKHRIRDTGHLSNDQCAASLLQIIDGSQRLPRHVALAHVSQQCNTNALAIACTNAALDARGIQNIAVRETHPDRLSGTMIVQAGE